MRSNSKVVQLNKTIKVDVGICYKTMPPLIIPLSEEAKRTLSIVGGDCAIFIDDEADKVLSLFGNTTVVARLDDYIPILIVPMTINMLH